MKSVNFALMDFVRKKLKSVYRSYFLSDFDETFYLVCVNVLYWFFILFCRIKNNFFFSKMRPGLMFWFVWWKTKRKMVVFMLAEIWWWPYAIVEFVYCVYVWSWLHVCVCCILYSVYSMSFKIWKFFPFFFDYLFFHEFFGKNELLMFCRREFIYWCSHLRY